MEKVQSQWFKQQKGKALEQPWRLSYADSVLLTGAITTGNSKITAEYVVGTRKAIETTQKNIRSNLSSIKHNIPSKPL